MRNAELKSSEQTISPVDLRSSGDRRRRPTPIISRYTFFRGRRKTVRRNADRTRHIFVDQYGPGLLVVFIAILLLSLIDATMTLHLIDEGIVEEANPVMAYFLRYGSLSFFLAKCALTMFAIAILCVLKNVRIVRHIVIPVTIVMYLAIIFYEVRIAVAHTW